MRVWLALVAVMSLGFFPAGNAPFNKMPDACGNKFVFGANKAGQRVGSFRDVRSRGFIAQGAQYTTIDFPAAFNTFAYGINEAGFVVGCYDDMEGRHGFVYDGVQYTAIDFPEAIATSAYGINNKGQIVGMYVDSQGKQHGFLCDGDRYVTIDTPDSSSTLALAIDDCGNISGFCVGAMSASKYLHSFMYNGYHFIYDGNNYSQSDGTSPHRPHTYLCL